MIAAVRPSWAAPGGRIVVTGTNLPLRRNGPPIVRIGSHEAHVVSASRQAIGVVIPLHAEGGVMTIGIDGVEGEMPSVHVAKPFVNGIHQVDNPAFDGLGRLYVTESGDRGTRVPVPLYRVDRTGAREPVAVEVANPTSLALGPDGAMYVSSRFEGNVYRLTTDDRAELYATELGVPTGLAFSADGTLFVGDRSGSVMKVSPDRHVENFATLPSSVAAFHLAFGPDGCLYVSAPTLASHDPIYRITPERLVDTVSDELGRPQGLAFDRRGDLYVVDALAGASGLYRIDVTASAPTPSSWPPHPD